MAIVDIKHTQTIEEAFGQVAEGGSSGGGGALIIGWSKDTTDGRFGISLNATFAEIRAAMLAGRAVVINETPIEDIVSNTAVETVVKIEENPDYGQFTVYTNYESFGAVSEDEYPFVEKS